MFWVSASSEGGRGDNLTSLGEERVKLWLSVVHQACGGGEPLRPTRFFGESP